MKINRHNYEEYFMLYVDGELLPEERMEVEEFVQLNPDLKTEFDLLKHAVLPVHHIEFTDKDRLLKSAENINISNYQTYFLLYTDNELSAESKEKVEKFVLQNPDLQTDFITLQQAKLQPEHIEFTDKKVLFRTEKLRRTGAVIWFRLSVAAAIIGVLLFSAYLFINKDFTKNNTGLVHTKSIEKGSSNALKNLQTPHTAKVADIITPQPSTNNTALVHTQTSKKITTSTTKSPVIKENTFFTTIKNNVTIAATQTVQKNSQEKGNENNVLQNVNAKDKFAQQVSEDKPLNVIGETTVANEIATQPIKLLNADEYPIAQNAVYRELDISEEERTMYIGSAAINKNKLKGLFKKVSRLIAKNSIESEGF